MTETWLQNDFSDYATGQITPDGYTFLHKPRLTGRGGGVALLAKTNIKSKALPVPDFKTFECLNAQITLKNVSLQIFVIYRPPPSSNNKLSFTTFREEFSDFVTQVASKHKYYLILGDFNIHMDNTSSLQTRNFPDILDLFNLVQFVPTPTHRAGYILDLVISSQEGLSPRFLRCDDVHISDHSCVIFDLPQRKPPPVKQNVTYRKTRAIDIDSLNQDIANHTFKIEDIVQDYDQTLSGLLEKHAPTVTKCIVLRPNTQWYNENLRLAKVVRRRLERKKNKTRKFEDMLAYKKQCEYDNFLLNEAKQEFYSRKILANEDDKKKKSSLNGL